MPTAPTTDRTIILYHAKCPDGFGGAYAAWKKFGDAAEYRPLAYGKPVPTDLAGAHVYFIDFCYEQEIMNAIVSEAASVTVLDHHLGTRPVTESMPEHVFDNDRSGATIAWTYFHPDLPVPSLLNFIEDDDIYRFSFPDTRAVLAYLIVQPYEFETWDLLIKELDDRQTREAFFAKARIYAEYFKLLAQYAAKQGKKVLFEGYECLFATSHPLITMRSAVGAYLWEELPPLSLVVSAHPEGFGVSIRGNGSVDVAAIARKYGGNGHPNSAGFQISLGDPVPWTLIKDEESA
jgi:hypothetical protein